MVLCIKIRSLKERIDFVEHRRKCAESAERIAEKVETAFDFCRDRRDSGGCFHLPFYNADLYVLH